MSECLDLSSRVYVAGHRGLVGSALIRRLQTAGFTNILRADRRTLDLTDQLAVHSFFAQHQPEYVFLAAAKVGGILANARYPADFIRDNLFIQSNVIDAAWANGVRKLLFFGSSCIYPKHAEQPITEQSLLSGSLEPTNEWYAVAKIAGVKLCQAYRRQHNFDAICAMPTNLYGPEDNFELETSHVLPALIRKIHEAKLENCREVVVWGSGMPRREFLYVDDLADAAVFLMEHYSGEEIVNVGVGRDVSISELAALVAQIVGYQGDIIYDRSRPDGTPRKLLNISRLESLGWSAQTSLREGIERTYQWYMQNCPESTAR